MPSFDVSETSRLIDRLPHPDKVLFPEIGLTRRMLAEYYLAMGSFMLRDYRHRYLTVIRWPSGIQGKHFYQKHMPEGELITLNEVDQLAYWTGLGVIEWHVPLGHCDDPDMHDWMVMDLDPSPDSPRDLLSDVALGFARLLGLVEVPFLLKTSGKRGLHFFIGIDPVPHRVAQEAMERLARVLEKSFPLWVTIARLKKDRGEKIYLDYLQNGFHRTMAGVYSMRATERAGVSTPLRREELGKAPWNFTIRDVQDRMARWGDLFQWTETRVDVYALLQKI